MSLVNNVGIGIIRIARDFLEKKLSIKKETRSKDLLRR